MNKGEQKIEIEEVDSQLEFKACSVTLHFPAIQLESSLSKDEVAVENPCSGKFQKALDSSIEEWFSNHANDIDGSFFKNLLSSNPLAEEELTAAKNMLSLEQPCSSMFERADGRTGVSSGYRSYELDMLSHRFQAQPVLETAQVEGFDSDVKIVFPQLTKLTSRGSDRILKIKNETLDARVSLARTVFGKSNISVWHLSFTPATGGVFSEWDIIRLMKLYTMQQEGSNIKAETYLSYKSRERLSLMGLLYELSVENLIANHAAGGTVHINSRPSTKSIKTWELVCGLLDRVNPEKFSKAVDTLRGIFVGEDDSGEMRRARLKAYCGIASGVLDYERMYLSEAVDTLDPRIISKNGAVLLHRGSAIELSDDAQMFTDMDGDAYRKFGASPYLIIPQAVVIHNELTAKFTAVLFAYAKRFEKRKRKTPFSLRSDNRGKIMNSIRKLNNKVIFQFNVTQVFQYRSEREFYEQSHKIRGLVRQRKYLKRRCSELIADVKNEKSLDQRKREFRLTALGGIAAYVTMLRFVFDKSLMGNELFGWTLGACYAGIVVPVVLFFAVFFVVWRSYPRVN